VKASFRVASGIAAALMISICTASAAPIIVANLPFYAAASANTSDFTPGFRFDSDSEGGRGFDNAAAASSIGGSLAAGSASLTWPVAPKASIAGTSASSLSPTGFNSAAAFAQADVREIVRVSGFGEFTWNLDLTGTHSGGPIDYNCGTGTVLNCVAVEVAYMVDYYTGTNSYPFFMTLTGDDLHISGKLPIPPLLPINLIYGVQIRAWAFGGASFDYSHTALMTLTFNDDTEILGTASGESAVYREGDPTPIVPLQIGAEPPTSVPEPAMLSLLGMAALAFWIRKHRLSRERRQPCFGRARC